MKKIFTVLGLSSIFGIANAEQYSEGQLWSYQTRMNESQSKVLINKIESHEKLGKIFHISVLEVKVRNPSASNGVTTELPHFPVAEETLNKSLTKLLGKKSINPEYLEGYSMWKKAFDEGNAGIFTISVAEIVDVVEESINQNQ